MASDALENNYDVIERYYTGKISEDRLSAKQLELLERWEDMYRLYKQHNDVAKVIKMHRTRFGVSRPQAYNDWSCTERLFGALYNPREDFERHRVRLLTDKAINLALSSSTPDLTNLNRSLAILAKLLPKESAAFDASQLQPHVNVLQINIDNKLVDIDLSRPQEIPEAVRNYLVRQQYEATDAEITGYLTK